MPIIFSTFRSGPRQYSDVPTINLCKGRVQPGVPFTQVVIRPANRVGRFPVFRRFPLEDILSQSGQSTTNGEHASISPVQ